MSFLDVLQCGLLLDYVAGTSDYKNFADTSKIMRSLVDKLPSRKYHEALLNLRRVLQHSTVYDSHTITNTEILWKMLHVGLWKAIPKSVFTEEVTNHVVNILKHDPRLLAVQGTMRLRTKVSPLYLACLNRQVPLHLVDVMLKLSPTTAQTIVLHCYCEPVDVNILNDLQTSVESLPPERLKAVTLCFNKKN